MNRQFKERFQLPTAEDDLWHQVVVRLLNQRNMTEEQALDHLRLCGEMAFHHRFCERVLTHSFVENTATWLAEEMGFGSPRDKAQEWLIDLEKWELLVRNGSGSDVTYEFALQGLGEYFAACHLVARWVDEEDRQYKSWLPCLYGWWEQGGKMKCPNPHCRVTLPPFRALLQQAEYEEIFLLMVGLLKEFRREEMVMSGIHDDLNLMLKALSRCRYEHPGITKMIKDKILIAIWNPLKELNIREREFELQKRFNGLIDFGKARLLQNINPILNYCVDCLYEIDDLMAFTLRNENWMMRREVEQNALSLPALTLGLMGDLRAVKPLVTTLGPLEIVLRWLAGIPSVIRALRMMGDTATEVVIEALNDSDNKISMGALIALGWLKWKDLSAVELVIEALRSEDEDVRSAAVVALRRIGDTALDPLIQMLRDNSDNVRNAASDSLKCIDSETAIKRLIELLKDREVRKYAVYALAWMDMERTVPVLFQYLKDKDRVDRNAVAKTLGIKGSIEMLSDAPDEQVRHEIEKAIEKVRDQTCP